MPLTSNTRYQYQRALNCQIGLSTDIGSSFAKCLLLTQMQSWSCTMSPTCYNSQLIHTFGPVWPMQYYCWHIQITRLCGTLWCMGFQLNRTFPLSLCGCHLGASYGVIVACFHLIMSRTCERYLLCGWYCRSMESTTLTVSSLEVPPLLRMGVFKPASPSRHLTASESTYQNNTNHPSLVAGKPQHRAASILPIRLLFVVL